MLTEHIKASGRSRREWCEALGISQAFLSQLENGRRTPSLVTAVAIERATEGAVPVESWVPDKKDAA